MTASFGRLEPSRGAPLGATVRDGGVDFALFSRHATAVELCLFDAATGVEQARLPMPGRDEEVWHGFLPGAEAGLHYGYRVHGPWAPRDGDRFNAHKLLIDPYARELGGRLIWDDAVYGHTLGHPDRDLSFDTRDSAPFVPRSVVRAPLSRRRRAVVRPDIDPAHRVIYEAHVKGFTQRFPGLEAARRGRYAALGSRAVIRYLQQLGVTTLELLPVHAFADDHFLTERGLSNYWGYQSLAFMAPEGRYAHRDAVKELAEAIKALHRGGIEVFLDVVYNHTCEGNEMGPTLCYRGIDNRSYYRLREEDPRYYVDDTGCGNTVAAEHPRVLQLIMDSLRFWATEMHVDGFRFDLASALGRERRGFDAGAGFFDAVAQDPVLRRRTLIAEPWDIGPGGYQLGAYPSGWSEWNDRFRDTARRFWLRREPVLDALSDVLLGSSDTFADSHRAPQASINLISAHDGFTLADMVAYDVKHNGPNGEGNRDGHDHNLSWNHGVEGPSDDPDIRAARERSQRNLLATLLLAQGAPMLLAGDECGHTQQGNNNAYCQDNEASWIDWRTRRQRTGLPALTERLLRLRRELPVLTRRHRLHGDRRSRSTGLPEVSWLNGEGEPMRDPDWHAPGARFVALLLLGDADVPGTADGVPSPRDVSTRSDHVLIVINGTTHDVSLRVPDEAFAAGEWRTVLDTARVDGAPDGSSGAGSVGLPDRGMVHIATESMLLVRCYTGASAQA